MVLYLLDLRSASQAGRGKLASHGRCLIRAGVPPQNRRALHFHPTHWQPVGARSAIESLSAAVGISLLAPSNGVALSLVGAPSARASRLGTRIWRRHTRRK